MAISTAAMVTGLEPDRSHCTPGPVSTTPRSNKAEPSGATEPTMAAEGPVSLGGVVPESIVMTPTVAIRSGPSPEANNGASGTVSHRLIRTLMLSLLPLATTRSPSPSPSPSPASGN